MGTGDILEIEAPGKRLVMKPEVMTGIRLHWSFLELPERLRNLKIVGLEITKHCCLILQ